MTSDADQEKAWTRHELDAYLADRYVTFDELVLATGLDAGVLESLIETDCMPGPSYELRHREELFAHVNGEADTISIRTGERYFARDVIAWIERIGPRLQKKTPETLAPDIKSELRAAFRQGLADNGAAEIGYRGFVTADGDIDDEGLAAHFEDHIWRNWRQGTWGICVNGSEHMANIARKAVAVQRLKLLTEDGTKKAYTREEAAHVVAAMTEYDAIVQRPSPHDYHITSRAQLVDTVSENVGYELRKDQSDPGPI